MPPKRFAQGTDVSAEKSRHELELLLKQNGAREFAFYSSDEQSVIQYRINDRMVRHKVFYPGETDVQLPRRKYRERTIEDRTTEALEAEWRRRWRALLLVIKAKFEMVSSGASTFEKEFLADTLLPDGSTVGDAIGPKVLEAYATGQMPKSFLSLGSG